MTEWIIAHPWMTFFLALTAIEAAAKIAGAVCQTIVAVHGGQHLRECELRCCMAEDRDHNKSRK